MMLTTHQRALIDTFFPQTGPAWVPLPWLEIGAGLSLWRFKALYRHFRHEIEVGFEVVVPASEDGQMKRVARNHAWAVEEFTHAHDGADRIRMLVCEAARAFAVHEVMESLKIDGRHYFADALARDHGEGQDS